jgi:hypothetical protein
MFSTFRKSKVEIKKGRSAKLDPGTPHYSHITKNPPSGRIAKKPIADMDTDKEIPKSKFMTDRDICSQDPDCLPPDINEDDLIALGQHDPEALRAIFAVVLAPALGNQTTVRTLLFRTIALAHVLHVPGIGDKSLTALAKQLGVTKSLMSAYCCRIRDFASLDCRPGRMLTARKRMAEARRESHRRTRG